MVKRVALTALLPTTSVALNAAEPVNSDSAQGSPSSARSAENHALQPPAPSADVRPIGSRSTSASAPRPAAPTGKRTTGHQHFSQLIRKEARLRDDQVDILAAQARRLSRAKTDSNERITDNTLIRVAVDLLLQHPERLQGSTEAELRKSVGL